jgi:hypothetical protein
MAEGRVLKSKYYKYPSKSEKEGTKHSIPTFYYFNIPYVNEMHLFLEGKVTIEEASRRNHIYHWNIHLKNRLGKLRETYWYLIILYQRGFSDDYKKCNDEELVNKVQFSYYGEIFYYLFFSTRDVLGQFINSLYGLGIEEENLKFSIKSFEKIEDEIVKSGIYDFLKETKMANNYRNGFTHRFPIDTPDRRTLVDHSEDKTFISRKTGSFVTSSELIENMTEVLNSLKSLLNKIKNQANL